MTVFWLLLVVILLALGQVWLYGKCALRRIRYERHFEKNRIFAGETVRLVETIENDKLLPLPWLRVETAVSPELRFGQEADVHVSGERFHRSVFFLGPFKRITRRHHVTPRRRGWYDCRLVSLTAGDLLGLGSPSKDLLCDSLLMVYPRVAQPDELPYEALRWQGEVSVRRWTDPDPILSTGVREYRSGDSRRDISWRMSARMDELYVHQRDYTVEPRLLLLFNVQIREDLWGGMEPKQVEVIEQGLSLAAALCSWGTRNGYSAGLRANAGSQLSEDKSELISIDPGEVGLEGLLEALALLRIEMRMRYMNLLQAEIDRGSTELDILCVSAYWSEALEEKAAVLRRMGNRVQHIPIRGGEAR